MDDKTRSLLRSLGGVSLDDLVERKPFGSLAPSPPRHDVPLASALTILGGLSSSPLSLGSALSPPSNPSSYIPPGMFGSPPPTILGRSEPKSALTAFLEVKRKVYFAFDFDDQMRVNNVRQAGKVGNEKRTFYDRSIWESRNIKNEDNLKNLMRGAVTQSSAVCVLIGTSTWKSRWVKYEIARAVVDQKGLVAVHINGINHHFWRRPDPLGYNALNVLGIYRATNGNFYLYENQPVVTDQASGTLGWGWGRYEDFTDPVPLPRYVPMMDVNYVTPLGCCCDAYDYVADFGYQNIGGWIDAAAKRVGR